MAGEIVWFLSLVPTSLSEAKFSHVAPAVWLTSTLYDDYGKLDRVPKPWTPVECKGRTLSVWGRTMSWGKDSILPSSIKSQGIELLKRPMQIAVKLDGKEHVVPLSRFRITGKKKSKVTLVAEGEVRARGIHVTADMWMEYDGFLWVTLSIENAVKDRKVEGLHIVVPMDAKKTTLYQTYARPLAGWIEKEPIKMSWLADPKEPYVDFYHWFGDEDSGLGFTYTTLEHWRPESESNFCTLYPGGEIVTYKMNLIEKPVSVDGRTYKFGIQATPIKPLPPDYHSMRASTLYYGAWRAWEQQPENEDMLLIWPTPTGLAMKGLQDPYHINAKVMADAVKYAHDKGVAFVGVASCPQKISPLAEEFEDYKREWQNLPESTLDWDNVLHYQNCGRSYTLRKWLFYGWAVENVKRFGLDGIYYDGWMAGTMACYNPHHGCGWVDEKGERHLTVPVLEGREFNQRMIMFLEDHVKSPMPKTAPERKGFPRYHYWIHSWQFVPSVMGFATEWLTGEFAAWPLQGPSMQTPEGTYGKCLGLGLFRALCLSTNWGVPNLFDAIMWEVGEKHPVNKQTLMAYAWFLPHGVPFYDLYMNQATVVEITRILMNFETRKANFTPGWRKNPYLTIEAPVAKEVMVATWEHHQKDKVLAVVSNLKVEESIEVRLKWTGFANPKVKDARTGEALSLQDGRLTVKLPPESFVLLWIEKERGRGKEKGKGKEK